MHLDDRVTIATPEGVTLELLLAGLGSRFVARMLDTLIQGSFVFVLVFARFVTNVESGVVQAVVIVAVFLVVFAYDIPFELLNGGRTIGKMAAGIRVVGVSGEPVSFLASAIRNIVRIADFLPFSYVAGSITMVATRRHQRLGDLAAGTVVVRDRFPGVAAGPPLTVPADAVLHWDVSAIDAGDVAAIRHFLDRRLALPWPVRSYFAGALAARVAPQVAGVPYGAHPEYVLEGVVVAKQHRT